jgi:hypothetical protein
MEQKDCFRPDVPPDEEYPFPGSPQKDYCPDAEFQELEMEVLESEVKEQRLLPQVQKLLLLVLPLASRLALELPVHPFQQRLLLQLRPRSLPLPSWQEPSLGLRPLA